MIRRVRTQQMSFNGMPVDTPVNDRDSRWNPKFYRRKAAWVADLFRSRTVRLTAGDFGPLLTTPGDATIFLDPPYFVEGPNLYSHGFSILEHLRLAKLLRTCGHRWLLTYDDAPFIRMLYKWARVETVSVRYQRPDRPYQVVTELVITPG